MADLTFNDLPEAVLNLDLKLSRIETILNEKLQPKKEETEILTLNDLSKFLKLQKSTIYGYVHSRKIPYIKRGKVLYFEKSKILEWLKTYRQKTADEIKEEINNII